MHFDVFNGDADGICALHQLRLATPQQSQLITGVKRDVKLLNRLSEVCDSTITVFDISMDANKSALLDLLQRGNKITYFDHHFSGNIPDHPGLIANIDTSPKVCTSILVDRFLKGQYRKWAIVAAFGDNLYESAQDLANSMNLGETAIEQLCELGELINYNGYGQELSDLHFSPTEIYSKIKPFEDPLSFYQNSEILSQLKRGYRDDMDLACSYTPVIIDNVGKIYSFPFKPWSKRIAGVFSNKIANEAANLAHVVMADNGDKSYLVSVRAPLNRPEGADELCRQFETGGGRKAAAGINKLHEKDIDLFITRFTSVFKNPLS